MKIFRFFLLLLIFLSACQDPKKGWRDLIEKEDQKDLEIFFEILMKRSEFGFTLFGKKPMSVYTYILPDSKEPSKISEEDIHGLLLEKGWEVWSKYSHLIPSKNYTMIKIEFEKYSKKFNEIYISNKQEFFETFKYFKANMKEPISANFSFDSYLEDVRNISDKDQQLLGTLLGYGAKSSWAFDRIFVISCFYLLYEEKFNQDLTHLSRKSLELIELYKAIRLNTPVPINLKPSPGFSSLSEELNEITAHFVPFQIPGTDLGVTDFCVPAFMCLDNDPNVKELSESYKKTLDLLIEKYQYGSFLEVTLGQWSEG